MKEKRSDSSFVFCFRHWLGISILLCRCRCSVVIVIVEFRLLSPSRELFFVRKRTKELSKGLASSLHLSGLYIVRPSCLEQLQLELERSSPIFET